MRDGESLEVLNHNLITNYVIKEKVPSGRNRYDSLLHKRKGAGFEGKSGKTEGQREKLCYRKYSILCILNYRPFGKGKCNKYLL